jgi:transcriptional regulator with XRE-family HTH domain
MCINVLNHKEIVIRIFEIYETSKQIDLVAQLGIDKATINKWVKGTRLPTLEHFEKIVIEKNVTWDWLLEGRGPKYREEP